MSVHLVDGTGHSVHYWSARKAFSSTLALVQTTYLGLLIGAELSGGNADQYATKEMNVKSTIGALTRGIDGRDRYGATGASSSEAQGKVHSKLPIHM